MVVAVLGGGRLWRGMEDGETVLLAPCTARTKDSCF